MDAGKAMQLRVAEGIPVAEVGDVAADPGLAAASVAVLGGAGGKSHVRLDGEWAGAVGVLFVSSLGKIIL